MDDFCGSDFWDVDLTWNTDNPDFTQCFERTALVWVPCAFLWLFSPFDLYFSYSNKSRKIPRSSLNLGKMLLSVVLIILELIFLKKALVPSNEGTPVYVVDYISPAIKILTYVYYMVLLNYSLQKGVQSAAVHFLFWLLMTICKAITVRSVITHRLDDPDVTLYVVEIIYCPVVAALLFLNSWADATLKYPMESVKSEKTCPEVYASYLSRQWFSWFTSLIFLGYKKPLEQSDLWDLNPRDKSRHVVPIFDKNWAYELNKNNKKRMKELEGRAAYGKLKNGRTGGGGGSSSIQFQTEKKNNTDGQKEYISSILPPLFYSFGGRFTFGCFLKLIPDLLAFVSPMVLDLLIGFTSSDEETWKGFVYAGALFVSAFISTMFTSQHAYRMYGVSMNVRTSLTSAVYRKALLLSNSAKRQSSAGQIVNLMSVDVQKITDLIPSVNMIWAAPMQIGLALYFLWGILGPSSLAGMGVMILIIPINGWVTTKSRQYQISLMKKKDQRIKLMNEILAGIKVLKLYAWELSYEKQIMKIRTEEVSILKKMAYLNAIISFMWTCAPFMVALATFTTFILVDSNNVLNAQVAFVSLSLFNVMSMPLTFLPMMIVLMVQANVSLKRLNKFMNAEEIDPEAVSHDENDVDDIVIEHGTFSWEPETTVLRDISLRIKKGSFVAIVGTVGSGKSSLLSAILGDLDKTSGRVNTKGTIGYVAQQAWIQNAPLRDNILFGKDFVASKYDSVVEACALRPDFDILPAGDKTEIGEKGINLSGGQKQRVSLARATYNNADVFLFDDCLSAVDSQVGKHIFENLLGPNGLLKKKTRVLVTHGIQYLPRVDNIIVLKDGEISEMGTYKELLRNDGAFSEFIRNHLENADADIDELEDSAILEDLQGVVDIKKIKMKRLNSQLSETGGSDSDSVALNLPITPTNKKPPLARAMSEFSRRSSNATSEKSIKTESKEIGKSKLIEKETSETSNVKLSVFLDYVKFGGWWFFLISIAMLLISHGFSVGSNLFLSSWTSQVTAVGQGGLNESSVNSGNSTQEQEGGISREAFLGVYGAFGLGQASAILIGAFVMSLGALRAASTLHYKMLARVLKAPLSFFDVTPSGRLINRFAKDVDICDTTLLFNMRIWINCFFTVVATIFAISYSTPIFITVFIPVSILYFFMQRFYVATSRQLKRLESTTRSPIYSHFEETVTGSSTIRAFSQQDRFILDSEEKVDLNQSCFFPSIVSNRWLQVRLETIGNVLIFFAALFAVLARGSLEAGLVGLSVSYALRITFSLNMLVWWSADLETNIVAVERIKEYSEINQEADWQTNGRKPPKSWPEKGEVRFDHYQTRYRPGLDLVLKNVTCVIQPGEKVGIVGRTGAGKSSLTLAIFRIIEAAGGSITIDGQNISRLGLHDLRGRITIIPQDPVLFSGTLRINLDPFEQHLDETIWHSLELSHLKPFVKGLAAGLDHEISEGGENLSVGQRQLVCLARALLRKTKILVLDEATAAVDLETDDLIQKTIRSEFSDSTVITIAHRLNTIMDSDKVLVLDKGEIREYDSPANLLLNKDTIFSGMAKDAGIH